MFPGFYKYGYQRPIKNVDPEVQTKELPEFPYNMKVKIVDKAARKEEEQYVGLQGTVVGNKASDYKDYPLVRFENGDITHIRSRLEPLQD